MKHFIKLFLPGLLLLASCSSKVYKDKAFFSKPEPGTQVLAVLPAEVIFTGNLPKNWGPDRVSKMEIEESSKIQESIYDDLLFRATSSDLRNKWSVKLMDYRLINSKLQENGISIKDSWKLSSAELAKILGADMLIRTRVKNNRIMSEAAAAGINVGVSVLRDVISSGSGPVYVPRARASENDMSLSLYHSSKSEAIARISSERKLRARKLPVYVKN
ncbi:MAG: hypothetical protein B7X86_07665 [Sphingobacteriales bacterium 17-39-43]|uniref:hypothetical protein n=1 Tax=Daejeonella sp. TaxID=2805397 RepID=UPI000BD5045B|nr:hypothetical protein [Daejeonella sp.]OYZ31763.1 MAG: hypothetical protein B7Y24_07960 [Sphingobacteriales bacterium 16-39-50]OZA24912.1 MAG: hypothetical protein B7X86_07665 [Sphingobacteriales bacterium 17-39-43]HQT22846.1 hypothetical protein [Daejeonella sp.]HQT57045.1 hypothetical protein [Daejeonella sp.]